jgi:hypothetical protein
MKSSQQAKLAEKTEYRKSIEYLAHLATNLEKDSVDNYPLYLQRPLDVAKHIRRVLHGARG